MISFWYGVYPRSREYLADNTLGITLPLRMDCLLASGAAAITEATICTPFERLQSIVQNPVYDKKFKSLKFSFQYFLKRNPNNLFNGFSVISHEIFYAQISNFSSVILLTKFFKDALVTFKISCV